MASIRFLGLSAVSLLCLLNPTAAVREGGQCTVPTKFSPLGCYVDNDNGRALTGHSFQNEGMTIKACRRACSTYEYFGVENGHECFCGNSLIASTADIGDCNLPCGGNVTETCGAINRLNIYKKDGLVFSSVSSSSVISSTVLPSSAGSSTVLPSSSETVSSTQVASSTPSTTSESSTSVSPSSSSTSPPSSFSSSSETPSSSSTSTTAISSAITTNTVAPSTSPTSVLPSSTTVPSTTSTTFTTSTTSSTTSTTSTTSLCSLTTSFVVPSTGCWASIPATCLVLNQTPLATPASRTAAASACSEAFKSAGTIHPSIAPCLSDIPAAAANPTSAYSCVASASVYCSQTTNCAPASPPANTNVVPNGGFTAGAGILAPWTQTSSTGDAFLGAASVSSAQRKAGIFSLATGYYNNNGPASREWMQHFSGLVPGARYELSYWWIQSFGQAKITTWVRFTGAGVDLTLSEDGFNKNVGAWHQVSGTFVAGSSFGTISLGINAIRGGGPSTMYIDEVSLKRVL